MPKWDVSFPIPVSSSRLFKVRWTHLKPVGHCWEDLVFEWRGVEKLPGVTKGNFFLKPPLWEPVLLFSMVLLLEVIERRQLDFPSSHPCVCECMCTCCCFLTYHSPYHCAVCVKSAVIQAYLQPCGLAADCSLKVRTHDLWGPGQISVLGCCCLSLSRSRKRPDRQTGQLAIHTC